MTRLFRSKSCGHARVPEFKPPPPPPSSYYDSDDEEEEEEDEEEEEEEEEDDYYGDGVNENGYALVLTNSVSDSDEDKQEGATPHSNNGSQFPILDILVTALRKSLVCSVETDEVCSMDISSPVNVRHVSHVTFDRFNGFLGLPSEFEPEVPTRVPSASASVFGVSANSMQCSFDDRGNSVPTILLMMQKRLYSEGGLKAEGIFRINAENSQEEFVRTQLNSGVVPRGIDVHCLAGLIKAWLRELPTGVLDTLTPEQVMHCNTEEDCTQLVKLLPPMESAILDWAINLMADVVQQETHNKMNARNIAMVFAPNMTQMADPLTALIHAVQVMNLLKTLILQILQEREESEGKQPSSCLDTPDPKVNTTSSNSTSGTSTKQPPNSVANAASFDRVDYSSGGKFESFEEKEEEEEEEEEQYHSASGRSTPIRYGVGGLHSRCREGGYETSEWQSLRKGVRKLCRHPVFQLSKSSKKSRSFGVVSCKY
ncbi:rho GTPase-activating protein 5-like isoform X1 [Cucurbita maxima]|uniref:Rho GTPase-activating protein 5-like isoform X1 n=1 Tax=Cucurbita maxima TaxID=3661 RepID=A0A6J1IND8_CUCMA|nr:rho GTPase-activating protein 5-like isoform X1 [Cucurbita maxima]